MNLKKLLSLIYVLGIALASEAEMTASEAQLRIYMAEKKSDEKYYVIDFNEVLENFFSGPIADGFDDPRWILNEYGATKQKFKKKIIEVLEEESRYEQQGWFTFYHAMNRPMAFIMDILTEIRKYLLKNIIGENDIDHIQNFRTIWRLDLKKTTSQPLDLKSHISDVWEEIVEWAERDTGPRSEEQRRVIPAEEVMEKFRHNRFRDKLLSANMSLFSNVANPLEYTLRYWVENITARLIRDTKTKLSREIIHELYQQEVSPRLVELGMPASEVDQLLEHLINLFRSEFFRPAREIYRIPISQDDYASHPRMLELLKKPREEWSHEEVIYAEKLQRSIELNYIDENYVGGRLLVIHIHPDVVDKMAYLGTHVPLPWPGGRDNHGKPSIILRALKHDPQAFNAQILRLQNAVVKDAPQPYNCWRNGPCPTTNSLIAAVFVDPRYAYNKTLVDVSTHDLFSTKPEYRESLHNLIFNFLEKNKSYFPKTKSVVK